MLGNCIRTRHSNSEKGRMLEHVPVKCRLRKCIKMHESKTTQESNDDDMLTESQYDLEARRIEKRERKALMYFFYDSCHTINVHINCGYFVSVPFWEY